MLMVPVATMPTVAEQLASVWNFISGAGVDAGKSIWVFRNGVWLIYFAPAGLDEIGYFRSGEGVWLWAIQDCVLTYKGMTIQLFTGWNLIGWVVDEEPGIPPVSGIMDMLMPIMMIIMMGAMMFPMIKGMLPKKKEKV